MQLNSKIKLKSFKKNSIKGCSLVIIIIINFNIPFLMIKILTLLYFFIFILIIYYIWHLNNNNRVINSNHHNNNNNNKNNQSASQMLKPNSNNFMINQVFNLMMKQFNYVHKFKF